MSKTRFLEYDLIRCVACLFIIAIHSPIANSNANGLFLSSLSYFTVTGIGLFFMISGALLLPIKTNTSSFLKHRFSKVLFPTLFWSLFYMICNAIKGNHVNWVKSILSLPFSPQGNSVLWFMYTLMGLYLLSPILSRWLQNCSKKELQFYLALWCISLLYPTLKYFLKINTGNTGILYYFTGYAGYFVLGYYCKKFPESLKWNWILPLTLLAIIAPVYCKLYHIEVDFYKVFWLLSIFVVILCVFYYKLGITIGKTIKSSRFLTKVSNLSFGIYLTHLFVMRTLLWNWDFIRNIDSYYLQTLVIIILTFVGSALLSYLISLLPGSQYIIGYKNK